MKALKKMLTLGIAALLAATIFTGCGASDISQGVATNDYPILVGGVTLNSRPEGVAVLSQSLADVVLTIGYEETLKAKSNDCTQPELSVLPDVTIDAAAELKKLGVTVVLADTIPTQAQQTALQQQGITAIAITPAKNREDCKRLYREVGSVMRGGNTGYTRAEKSCDNVFYTLDDITRLVPATSSQSTACYLYDLQGSVATGDTLFGSLITYAGFFNAFVNETGGKVSISSILIANPYYIFCPTGMKEELTQSEDFKMLDAVVNGRVYELDPTLMQRQGNTMLDAVTAMVQSVYPELFETRESKKNASSEEGVNSSQSESGATTSDSGEGSAQGNGETATMSSTTSKPAEVAAAGELQYGNSGRAVLLMQERLNELGYMFTALSSVFDDGTLQAVKDFQYLNGYVTTGIATQELLDLMYSADAKLRN